MGNLQNPVALVAVIAAPGIAPFAALMVTSDTRLVVVPGLLRDGGFGCLCHGSHGTAFRKCDS